MLINAPGVQRQVRHMCNDFHTARSNIRDAGLIKRGYMRLCAVSQRSMAGTARDALHRVCDGLRLVDVDLAMQLLQYNVTRGTTSTSMACPRSWCLDLGAWCPMDWKGPMTGNPLGGSPTLRGMLVTYSPQTLHPSLQSVTTESTSVYFFDSI